MTDELDTLYERAAEDNVFFAEYSGLPAAAGDIRDLEHLAKQAGKAPEELLPELMSDAMGAIIDLCILGDVMSNPEGTNRVTSCQAAWDKLKEERDKGMFPRLTEVRKALGLPVADEQKQLGKFSFGDFG